MNKDRLSLIEQEIVKSHDEAAKLYPAAVQEGTVTASSPEYDAIRQKIQNLQFDHNIVTLIIHQGQP
jgi:hypothetical protein